MKKRGLMKKLSALFLSVCMIIAVMPGFTVMAVREYGAELEINGAVVDFENEAFSRNGILYVPVEELCGYLNLQITKAGDTYTITRLGSVLKLTAGNLVVDVDSVERELPVHPELRNGILYAPAELFSIGFGCPLEFSEDKRSANLIPNVYKITITENTAAAISAGVPEADTLSATASGTDNIFYNIKNFPQLEKSLFYLADLSAFEGKEFESVKLAVNMDRGEYGPTLRIMRTAPWKKGEVTYNTQPAVYENEYVDVSLPEATYTDKVYNITALAASARKSGEALSVKLLGLPHTSKLTSTKTSFMIRGVNHPKAPYILITVKESYIFPVKAPTDESMQESSKYSELELLRSLGVFTDNDEFPLDLGEGVQRQEFVKYALRLRNADAEEVQSEQLFSDVPKDAPFFSDVMEAYSLGLISGGEGISFRPYDRITVGEAITILGRMLNYDIYAQAHGGFTPGYFAAARQGKLYLGSTSETGVLSFKKMFTLLEDALDAGMLDIQKYNANGTAEYVFNEDMTILTEYWDAKKIEGVVTANEYSNITPAIPGKEGKIVIGTKELKLFFEPYNKYLGYKVRGWYNSDDELLYLGTLESDITKINIRDIEAKSEDASNVSFTYEKESGKRKSESFSKNNVIYNGKAIAPSDVKASLLNADGGSVTIVGNSLAVIEAFSTVTVYSVQSEEETVYDKYDAYNKVLRLAGKEYTFSDKDGKEVTIESLKKNDILSVAKSLDGELFKIYVSTAKINGVLESAENIGSPEQILTIGGAEYETSNLSKNPDNPGAEYWTDSVTIGAKGTFLKDVFGSIVGFIPESVTDIKGFILTIDSAGSTLGKRLQAAILTGGEDYEVYELAEKIQIDGSTVSGKDNILAKFTQMADVVTGQDQDGNDIVETVAQFKAQGIIFDLNARGEVNSIDTAYYDPQNEDKENSLHLRYTMAQSALKYKGNGFLSGKFFLDSAESIGVICYEKGNIDEYKGKNGGLSNDGNYNMNIYTIGTKTPSAAIFYRESTKGDSGATVDDTNKLMIVDKLATTFDEEGYEIKKLYYYSGTTRQSVIIPDEMVYKLTYNADKTLGNPNVVNEISRGDVVRFSTDDRGELNAINEYYDYETKSLRGNMIANFNDLNRTYGGYTTLVDGEFIKVSNVADCSDDVTYTWVNATKFSNFCRYEVSAKGVDVYPATLNDIRTVESVEYNPTGIIMHSAYENMRANVYLIEMNQPAGTGIYKVSYSGGADDDTIGGIPEGFVRYNPGDFAVASSAVPTRKDHTFTGWKIKGGDDTIYRGGDSVPVNGDVILDAQWVYTPTYKITFRDESGTPSFSAEWAAKDENLQDRTHYLPDAQYAASQGLNKDGYILIGWKMGNREYAFGDEYIVSGEAVFDAVWMRNWSGSAAKADPEKDSDGYYLIENGEDLAWLSEKVKTTNNIKAKLANDIYLNNFEDCGDGKQINETSVNWYDNAENVASANNWASYAIKSFAGEFDGQNHTIYGLYLKGDVGTGLFNTIAGGTVKNIIFTGAYLESTTKSAQSGGYSNGVHKKNTAILAATVSGTAQVSNITVYGKIVPVAADCDAYTTAAVAGNVVGSATFTNCVSYVTIDTSLTAAHPTTGAGQYGVGAIIGTTYGAGNSDTITLTGCINHGNITLPHCKKAGALVGCTGHRGSTVFNSCGSDGGLTVNGDTLERMVFWDWSTLYNGGTATNQNGVINILK